MNDQNILGFKQSRGFNQWLQPFDFLILIPDVSDSSQVVFFFPIMLQPV